MKILILTLVLVALWCGYLVYVELVQFMAEIALDPNTFRL